MDNNTTNDNGYIVASDSPWENFSPWWVPTREAAEASIKDYYKNGGRHEDPYAVLMATPATEAQKWAYERYMLEAEISRLKHKLASAEGRLRAAQKRG